MDIVGYTRREGLLRAGPGGHYSTPSLVATSWHILYTVMILCGARPLTLNGGLYWCTAILTHQGKGISQ